MKWRLAAQLSTKKDKQKISWRDQSFRFSEVICHPKYHRHASP
jgi:hypothetical protein